MRLECARQDADGDWQHSVGTGDSTKRMRNYKPLA